MDVQGQAVETTSQARCNWLSFIIRADKLGVMRRG